MKRARIALNPESDCYARESCVSHVSVRAHSGFTPAGDATGYSGSATVLREVFHVEYCEAEDSFSFVYYEEALVLCAWAQVRSLCRVALLLLESLQSFTRE
eukprot:6415457-Amphidinium_carterae.1